MKILAGIVIGGALSLCLIVAVAVWLSSSID